MGAETLIEWCDSTFNPWWGCTEASAECDRCYARTWAKFTGHAIWGAGAPRRFFSDAHWAEPLAWDRAAAKAGERRRVFCASMADVLEERGDLEPHRRRLWSLIRRTEHLDWLLLTKRAGALGRLIPAEIRALPNVWPGVTCGHPDSIWRVEKLVAVECAGPRWVSAEPLLGPLDLRPFLTPDRSGLAWVIAGGESGPGHRPMELAWMQDLADQCERTGAPIFVKQDSGPRPRKQGRIPDALWARKQCPRPSRARRR
jgi:protein gp37